MRYAVRKSDMRDEKCMYIQCHKIIQYLLKFILKEHTNTYTSQYGSVPYLLNTNNPSQEFLKKSKKGEKVIQNVNLIYQIIE